MSKRFMKLFLSLLCGAKKLIGFFFAQNNKNIKQEYEKRICTISGEHSRPMYDVSWCKQIGLIATACADDEIRVFKENAETATKNEPVFVLTTFENNAHSQDVNKVSWNRAQHHQLLSCCDYGTIKIWKFSE